MKRLLAIAVICVTWFALVGTPAAEARSDTTYRSKNFFCSSSKTTASVKMYEWGLSGVMQFQAKFYAQVYYGGRWHSTTHRRYASRVVADSYSNHFYGYISQTFTWSTTKLHRELVKMIWWHRYPTYKVATKSLISRSCY